MPEAAEAGLELLLAAMPGTPSKSRTKRGVRQSTAPTAFFSFAACILSLILSLSMPLKARSADGMLPFGRRGIDVGLGL